MSSNSKSGRREYSHTTNALVASVALVFVLLLSACVSNKKFEAYKQSVSQDMSALRSRVSQVENTDKTQNSNIENLQQNQENIRTKLNASIKKINSLQKKLSIVEDSLTKVQVSVNELGDRLKIIEKYKEDQDFYNRNIETNSEETDLFSLDEYVLSVSFDDRNPDRYDDLVALITKKASSKYEKARAIFIWIANNISYDVDYKIYDGDATFRLRKGVCAGYSALYQELCRRAGLEVTTISGISKDITYKKGDDLESKKHAWNAVKDDNGRWFFVDATWGAGYVNGGVFTRKLAAYWFDPNPSIFALSHLPSDSDWQLIEKPVSRNEFETYPPIYPNLALMGLDGTEILNHLRNDANHSFPYMYTFDGMLKINQIPLTKNLSSNKTYTFSFTTPKEYKIAIIQGSNWTHFNGDGETKTVDYKPSKGPLKIYIKTQNDDNYWSVFVYNVD